MADTPKRPYEAPPPVEEPKKPEEEAPKTDPNAPPVDSAGEEPTKEQLEAAALYVEMYDTGVGLLCEALVKDPANYPAKHFAMRTDLREQSTRHLAKGLAKGGNKFNMPWWGALCMVLALQGFLTWQSVKAAKADTAERKQGERNRARASRGDRSNEPPIEPTIVRDANGQPVKVETSAPTATPAPKARPVTVEKDYGPCQAEGCTNRVHRKGKTTCGQSCAAKLTNAKRRAAKAAAVSA